MTGRKDAGWRSRPCPMCARPSFQAYHPFCSPRCADVDLGRWLRGSYVIPGTDGDAATGRGRGEPGGEDDGGEDDGGEPGAEGGKTLP